MVTAFPSKSIVIRSASKKLKPEKIAEKSIKSSRLQTTQKAFFYLFNLVYENFYTFDLS